MTTRYNVNSHILCFRGLVKEGSQKRGFSTCPPLSGSGANFPDSIASKLSLDGKVTVTTGKSFQKP